MLGLDSRAYNELHSGGTLSGMGGRRPSAARGELRVWGGGKRERGEGGVEGGDCELGGRG